MAQCQHGLAARDSIGRVIAAGESCAQPVADEVQAWAKLYCRIEPGTIAADAGSNQQCECPLSVWLCNGKLALSNGSTTLTPASSYACPLRCMQWTGVEISKTVTEKISAGPAYRDR